MRFNPLFRQPLFLLAWFASLSALVVCTPFVAVFAALAGLFTFWRSALAELRKIRWRP